MAESSSQCILDPGLAQAGVAQSGPAHTGPAHAGPAHVGQVAEERAALAVARGICRLFARNDVWCIAEMTLPSKTGGSNRRADLMGIDPKGRIIIVEIKVSRADLLGDTKWTDYLDHCDRFYWGLPPHLDRACLDHAGFHPEHCGVIVADGYDAEIVRPAPSLALNAARRKAGIERLARASLRRHLVTRDPHCAPWGGEG